MPGWDLGAKQIIMFSRCKVGSWDTVNEELSRDCVTTRKLCRIIMGDTVTVSELAATAMATARFYALRYRTSLATHFSNSRSRIAIAAVSDTACNYQRHVGTPWMYHSLCLWQCWILY